MEKTVCGRCENNLEAIDLGGSFNWCDRRVIDPKEIDMSRLGSTKGGQCPSCGLVYGYNQENNVRRLLIADGRLLPEEKPDLSPGEKRQLFPIKP